MILVVPRGGGNEGCLPPPPRSQILHFWGLFRLLGGILLGIILLNICQPKISGIVYSDYEGTLNCCKIIRGFELFYFFLMLAFLRRTSFLTTFYGLYFSHHCTHITNYNLSRIFNIFPTLLNEILILQVLKRKNNTYNTLYYPLNYCCCTLSLGLCQSVSLCKSCI